MAIYQFNSDRVRVTTHDTLLDAQEITGIPSKKILSAINAKSFCDGQWYFSRQPFLDILFGPGEDIKQAKKNDEVDKGNKVVKCNFGISHELNDRVNKAIRGDEDRAMLFRKALVAYLDKLENETKEEK